MIDWMIIPKHGRYLSCLTIPLVLIISAALTKIKCKKVTKILIPVVVLFLAITSLHFTNVASNYFRDGIKGSREVSKLIPELNGEIYTDYLALGQINYFSGFKYVDKIRCICDIRNETELQGSYVIVGGARGVDIYWKVPLEIVPNFVKSSIEKTKEGWDLIKTINGKETGYRKYNMSIYYVPKINT